MVIYLYGRVPPSSLIFACMRFLISKMSAAVRACTAITSKALYPSSRSMMRLSSREAMSVDLPHFGFNFVILKAFYPLVLKVSFKFSIHFHPIRMLDTRGDIIFYFIVGSISMRYTVHIYYYMN